MCKWNVKVVKIRGYFNPEVDVIDVSDADGIELVTGDEDENLEESKKEKLIQEDIKKMKQIIKPITKI